MFSEDGLLICFVVGAVILGQKGSVLEPKDHLAKICVTARAKRALKQRGRQRGGLDRAHCLERKIVRVGSGQIGVLPD